MHSIPVYHLDITDDRRPILEKLQALILEMYPKAVIVISYGILMYKVKPGWVGLGYRKDGVSLYTNGTQHIADYLQAYPKVKSGKGCLNFKLTDSIDMVLLKKVIRHAMEQID